MQCRSSLDHHRYIFIHSEYAESNVVEDGAEYCRPAMVVSVFGASSQYRMEHISGMTSLQTPATVVFAPISLHVGEVARYLNFPFFRNRGLRGI